jgi:mRNA-degrading endonuclease YafQ of YafQ-DinJ toxin-antitoxin module
MYTLITTSRFDRRIAKFQQAHPDLNAQLAQTLRDLESNPLKPRLRLHPLKGELEGLHAVSITHTYRITLLLNIQQKEIALLDIGSHDEVYR